MGGIVDLKTKMMQERGLNCKERTCDFGAIRVGIVFKGGYGNCLGRVVVVDGKVANVAKALGCKLTLGSKLKLIWCANNQSRFLKSFCFN